MLKFMKHMNIGQPATAKFLKEAGAAKALEVSLSTMQRLRKEQKIPFIQLGAQIRYTPELIEEITKLLTVPACPKTVSKSATIGSPSSTIPLSGKQPGTTPKIDKHAALLLAQKTFKVQ